MAGISLSGRDGVSGRHMPGSEVHSLLVDVMLGDTFVIENYEEGQGVGDASSK